MVAGDVGELRLAAVVGLEALALADRELSDQLVEHDHAFAEAHEVDRQVRRYAHYEEKGRKAPVKKPNTTHLS